MNNMLKEFSFILLLLSLILTGCKKENNEVPSGTELPIVSELPILYQGCNLKVGDNVLISDQVGFDTVFNADQVSQITVLQNIDFSKYDVLVGADVFTHGIFKLKHNLRKTDDSLYTYTVKVYYDLTLPAGTFFYGIIIDKLSSNANVNFVVIKINE